MQPQSDRFDLLVRHGCPFVLPQMFAPRFESEQFQISIRLLRILVETPSSGAIPQPPLPQLLHDAPEAFAVFRGDTILNGHEDRTVLEIRLKIRVRFRPMGRWPQVNGFVDDQWEEPNQGQSGDEARSSATARKVR
jgi:hypothetical protein